MRLVQHLRLLPATPTSTSQPTARTEPPPPQQQQQQWSQPTASMAPPGAHPAIGRLGSGVPLTAAERAHQKALALAGGADAVLPPTSSYPTPRAASAYLASGWKAEEVGGLKLGYWWRYFTVVQDCGGAGVGGGVGGGGVGVGAGNVSSGGGGGGGSRTVAAAAAVRPALAERAAVAAAPTVAAAEATYPLADGEPAAAPSASSSRTHLRILGGGGFVRTRRTFRASPSL